MPQCQACNCNVEDEDVVMIQGSAVCRSHGYDSRCERCDDFYDSDDDGTGEVLVGARRIPENWCAGCMEDHSAYCEECNSYVDRDSYSEIGDGSGDYACDNCIANMPLCHLCEEPSPLRSMRFDNNGNMVCAACCDNGDASVCPVSAMAVLTGTGVEARGSGGAVARVLRRGNGVIQVLDTSRTIMTHHSNTWVCPGCNGLYVGPGRTPLGSADGRAMCAQCLPGAHSHPAYYRSEGLNISRERYEQRLSSGVPVEEVVFQRFYTDTRTALESEYSHGQRHIYMDTGGAPRYIRISDELEAIERTSTQTVPTSEMSSQHINTLVAGAFNASGALCRASDAFGSSTAPYVDPRFSNRCVSFEIETGPPISSKSWSSFQSGCPVQIHVKGDGSLELGGVEVLLSMMRGRDIEAYPLVVWDYFKNNGLPIENHLAGMHIHVDARDIFTYLTVMTNARVYPVRDYVQRITMYLDACRKICHLFISSRRAANSYCADPIGSRGGDRPACLRSLVEERAYPAVAYRSQTIEFRLWPSTNSVLNAIARAQLSQRMIDKIARCFTEPVPPDATFSDGADEIKRRLQGLASSTHALLDLSGTERIAEICNHFEISDDFKDRFHIMHDRYHGGERVGKHRDKLPPEKVKAISDIAYNYFVPDAGRNPDITDFPDLTVSDTLIYIPSGRDRGMPMIHVDDESCRVVRAAGGYRRY